MTSLFRKGSFILSLAVAPVFFAAPFQYAVADILGDRRIFFVNPTCDATDRTSVPATLEYVGGNAYFYVEDSYLNSLSPYGH